MSQNERHAKSNYTTTSEMISASHRTWSGARGLTRLLGEFALQNLENRSSHFHRNPTCGSCQGSHSDHIPHFVAGNKHFLLGVKLKMMSRRSKSHFSLLIFYYSTVSVDYSYAGINLFCPRVKIDTLRGLSHHLVLLARPKSKDRRPKSKDRRLDGTPECL